MKFKKLLTLTMTAMLSVSLLVGCGSTSAKEDVASNGQPSKQELVFNLGEDPKTIDPQLNTTSGAGTVICNAFEGLYRMNGDSEIVPGVAEMDYELSEDKLIYTFKLRQDAKWSDGQPVTAKDFEYAWKRALNPKVGAEYAGQLYYIKGAEEYNKAKGTDAELDEKANEVGIKVIDDHTLQVELVSPTPYFLQLLAFPTYFPVREDIVEGNDAWATKPETYISNGAFKLVEWKIKDALVFEKNDQYWDAENVTLEKIEMKMIAEETSAHAAFQAGQLDMTNNIPSAEIQNSVANGTGQIFSQIGTYFYMINVSGEGQSIDVLKNSKLIQALNMAIDREAIVENVTKGEQVPATSYVPPTVLGQDGNRFSKEYFAAEGDIEAAKKLLEESGFPGGEGLPTLTLMFNTEGSHVDVAQAIQSMWKEIGVNVELKNQEWKVFLDTRNKLDYQIARHGWVGDYVDPMTFLDMWTTDNGNNDCGYSNAEYDKLINDAKKESDSSKREEMLKKAEDILLTDMPIIPIYHYTQPKSIKPYVKGVTVNQLGKVDFKDASIEK